MRLGVKHFNGDKPDLEEFLCAICKKEIQSNLGQEEASVEGWVLILKIMA